MKNLPPFEQWFYRDDYRALDYRIRFGENEGHDAVYLSSYLHDARIDPAKIVCQRKNWSFRWSAIPGSWQKAARLRNSGTSGANW